MAAEKLLEDKDLYLDLMKKSMRTT